MPGIGRSQGGESIPVWAKEGPAASLHRFLSPPDSWHDPDETFSLFQTRIWCLYFFVGLAAKGKSRDAAAALHNLKSRPQWWQKQAAMMMQTCTPSPFSVCRMSPLGDLMRVDVGSRAQRRFPCFCWRHAALLRVRGEHFDEEKLVCSHEFYTQFIIVHS